jgi:hypothetical protein
VDSENAGVGVRFYEDAYKNEAKSKEAGLPVFDTVDWCEIRVLAERDTVCGPVAKMSPDPRQRFPEAWAKYQRDRSSEGLVGTPLREVAWLGRGEVETFKHAGVKTLEQLAAISDANVTKFPGGIALRQKAKDAIKAAKDAAPLQAMSDELAKRDVEIDSLKAQIAEILESKRKKAKE